VRVALVLALLALVGGGCSLFEKVPPVEVCVVYKGKRICAVKRDGVWMFSADLSPEEKEDIVKGIDGN